MISVLTVNYRSAEDTAGLARSLVDCPPEEPFELVIANHSPGESIPVPDAIRSHARVLEAPNDGYATGVNAAFRASRGDLLFLANPDLRVTAGAFAAARCFLDAHPDVGVLLPLLWYPDGAVQDSVRRFYTWPVALYARSPLRALGLRPNFWRRYLYADLSRTEPVDVDWGLGGAMFLRRADCIDGTVFDPRFFLYFEDVDLCYRLWQRGRRVVYYPSVRCVHAHRRGSALPVGRHAWHHLRSFVRFVRKYRGLPQRPPRALLTTGPS